MSTTTAPKSRMLKTDENQEAAVAEIVNAGGLAWVTPEYGGDMGHENVYWGERLNYFEGETVRAAADKGEHPCVRCSNLRARADEIAQERYGLSPRGGAS